MPNINDGSLNWKARIDYSALGDDAEKVKAIIKGTSNLKLDLIDTSKMVDEVKGAVTIIREKAQQDIKSVSRDGVSIILPAGVDGEKAKIDAVTDYAKKKQQELADYIKSIPFEVKGTTETTLSAAQIDAINARSEQLRQQQFAGLPIQTQALPTPGGNASVTNNILGENFSAAVEIAQKAYADLSQDTQQFYASLANEESVLQLVTKAQTELTNAYTKGLITQSEYNDQTAKLNAAQTQLTEGIKILNAEQAKHIDLNDLATNTLQEKKDAVTQLKAAYSQLTEAEAEDVNIGGKMITEIQGLNNKIQEQSASIEKGANILTTYRNLRNKISSDAVNGIVNQADIEKAATLERSIRNSNAELRLLSSNTVGLDAIKAGVSGIVGAFTAAGSVMSIFTSDNQKAQKILQDTIAVMFAFNGVEQLAQSIAPEGKLNLTLKTLLAIKAATNEATAAQTADNAAQIEGVAATDANIASTEADIAAKEAQTGATTGAATAQQGLNTAMLENPAAILIGAIAILATGIILYASRATTAKDIQEALNKKMLEGVNAVDKERAALDSLLVTANDENASKRDRLDAVSKINALSPTYLGNLTLENIATKEGTQAINDYVKSLQLKAQAEAYESQLVENYSKINDLKQKASIKINDNSNLSLPQGTINVANENVKNTLATDLTPYFESNQKIVKSITDITLARDADSKSAENNAVKNKLYYEQQLSDQEKQLNSMTASDKGFDALQQKIKDTKAILKEWDPKPPTINTEALINKYDNLIKKIAEVNTKFNLVGAPKDVSQSAQIKQTFDEITKEIEKFNKDPKNKIKITQSAIDGLKTSEQDALAAAAYEKQTEDLKKEYSLKEQTFKDYQAWVLQFGKESADKQFGGQVQSYKDYLNEQIAATIAGTNKQNESVSAARLKGLNDRLKKAEDAETEYNRKTLENALASAQTQKEKLETLDANHAAGKTLLINNGAPKDELDQYEKSYQKSVDSINKEFSKIDINSILKSTTATTKTMLQQQIDALQDYVNKTKNLSASAREAVEKDIDNLNSKLLTATDGKDTVAEQIFGDPNTYDTYITKINEQIDREEAHIRDLNKGLKEINDRTALRKDKKPSDEDAATLVLINDQLKQAHQRIEDLAKLKPFAHFQDGMQLLQDVGQALQQLGNSVGQMNEGLGDTLKDIGTLVSDGANLAAGIASGNPQQMIQSAVKLVTDVIGMIAAARQSKIEADKQLLEFNNALIVGQVKYNEQLLAQEKIQSDITKGAQEQLIAQIKLNDAKQVGYQTDLDSLKQQLIAQGQQITGAHEVKYGGVLGLGRKTKTVQDFGSLGITTDMSNDQIAAILQQAEAMNKLTGDTKNFADEWLSVYQNTQAATQAAADYKEQLTEAFSGTTAGAIAQSIVDGLAAGKKTFADFSDDVNKMISTSLMDSIKEGLLNGQVAKIWKQFQDDVQANTQSDGTVIPLTPSQIAQLKDGYQAAIKQGSDLLAQAETAFPDLAKTLAGANGLTASIQGMTENKADELAGLYRNQLAYAKKNSENLTAMLLPIQNIEKNTANTVTELQNAVARLDKMVTGISSIAKNTAPTNTTLRDAGLNL